jgi:phage tail protein X
MMFHPATSAKENDMPDQPDSFYTVQPGDTLHALAQLCYHDRNKWQRIRQANAPLQGFDPDQPLPAGLQLTLPLIPELTTTITAEEGDTLHALADFFYFSEGQWQRIRQANAPLQGFDPDQPLPAGLQLTLPFIPERTILLVTNEGDTLQALAQTYYDDQNQSVRIGEANPALFGIPPDQPLPAGLQLTLPFIPAITTAILTEEGDTLRELTKFFYFFMEDRWVRIRQVNAQLQGFDPDQPLPAGLQLTLPSFTAITTIIIEEGDTFRSLGQAYYHNGDRWVRIRQANAPLQGFSSDQPLPVGLQLALPSVVVERRLITTGNNDTFVSLARTFYQNANRWPVIRQANHSLQKYNSNQRLPAGIRLTIP